MTNLLLWVAGVGLIALGSALIRAPYARLRDLEATQANLQRYEGWRGVRRTEAPIGVTGADEMRRLLRGQVMRWGLAIVAGVVLVVAGFAVR